MAPNEDHALAQRLAAHVDGLLATTWTATPRAGLLLTRCDSVETVALVAIEAPADVALALMAREHARAAFVSTLGHVTRRGGDGEGRARVRITMAATCCATSTIIRYADGGVDRSDEANGPLVGALRSWAGLASCSCLVRQADAPTAAQSVGASRGRG